MAKQPTVYKDPKTTLDIIRVKSLHGTYCGDCVFRSSLRCIDKPVDCITTTPTTGKLVYNIFIPAFINPKFI